MRARVAPRVLLTDFGLAKDVRTESRYTRTGETLGTPSYMSPELARGEFADLAPASDVWALACVLQELLTGRPAFDGESTAALVGRVVLARAEPLGPVAAGLPPDLRRLIDACFTVEATARPSNASALCDDLGRVLRGERPLPRPRRGRPWGVAAAALVAAGVGLGWWAGRRPPDLDAATRDRSAAPALPPAAPADPRLDRAEALARQAAACRLESPRAALDALSEALALAPDRDDWRLERGVVAWWLTDSPTAHTEWAAVRAGSPLRPLAVAYRATLRWLDRDRDGALALLPEIEVSGGVAGAIARVLLAAGRADLEAARAACRGQADPMAAVLLGRLELDAPKPDPLAAIRAFDLALAGGAPILWAFHGRARARVAARDGPGAIADYRRAVAIRPDRPELRVNLAHALFRSGAVEEALAELDALLQDHPTHPQARTIRAAVYFELRRFRESVADLDVVLAAHPGHADAARNRADSKLACGDVEGALADLDLAIRTHPTDFRAYNNRGGLRLRRGDAEGALADYARAVELDPREWVSRNSLGLARWRTGDLAGAEADFRAALARDPDYPTARANLGALLYQQQRWADAATEFRHLLSVAGDDPRFHEVRDALSECERRLAEAR